MAVLYHEMLDISENESFPVLEQMRAKTLFHIFPTNENLDHILDSIYVQWFVVENDEYVEKRPYYTSFIKLTYHYGQREPAIMKKILSKLEQPLNYEQILIYSDLIGSFFDCHVSKSLNYDDMAACLKIIAETKRSKPITKQNLFKIAEIQGKS